MSNISPDLVKAVKQLGSSLKNTGDKLEEMNSACIASGRVPDALMEVLDASSAEILNSAKSFAALGGQATVALGSAASHMEEAAWAMEREIWWKVAEEFNGMSTQLMELNLNFGEEAALIGHCNPQSKIPEQIINSGADIGAAGYAMSIAAGELTHSRVNEGLQHVLTTGELFSAAGKGLLKTSDELDTLSFDPWADSCTCGTFKWERQGWIHKSWVLYECVKIEGIFCDTCEWQVTARKVRFHSKKPVTPEPRND